MTNCAFCRTDISAPADQYGPIQAPVCQACWLWANEIACPICTYGNPHCRACQGTGIITIERLQIMANPNDSKLAHTSHRLLSRLEVAAS